MTDSEARWYELARQDIGVREGPGKANNPVVVAYYSDAGFPNVKRDSVAWCAAYVGAWLVRAGKEPSRSLLARSYDDDLYEELDTPREGCIVVLTRGREPWMGHVGFFVRWEGNYIVVLGGNQKNAVNESRYHKDRLISFRWPTKPLRGAPRPPEVAVAPAPDGLMDRAKFYAALRDNPNLFGAALSPSQRDGMENLLDIWRDYYSYDAIDLLSYNLATTYHETAYTMQPIEERGSRSYFDKYEPGTRIGRALGNTTRGDGYRFRGEGHVMNTGRRNARKATQRLNEVFDLGIDLEANPEKRGDPFISAHSLFLGNKEGWWTGRDLLDFLDGVDENDAEDLREYISARPVVNGTDKARKIGLHAVEFERALRAAGYTPREVSRAEPAPGTSPDLPAPAPAPTRNVGVVLRRGSRGARVAELIRDLHALKLYQGPMDDVYGPATERAVRKFQYQYGDLMVDGVAGRATLDRLDELRRDGKLTAPSPGAAAGGSLGVGVGAAGVAAAAGWDWGLIVFVLVAVTVTGLVLTRALRR